MNEKLQAGLNQARRDALVPYYLKHVIPHRGLSSSIAAKITTAEDLYEYLLIDPQVSGQIKSSRIAEAVASTQLYLHRCQEQLEPETDQEAMQEASRHNGYFSRWNAYNKRYANWAGLQRLLHYPASYIDPELRYNKTQLFVELESAINQGRITEERVELAFTQYVSSLRNVLDIRYDSGYQVEPANEQGAAYFCGSITGTTGEYYWRRVDKTDVGSGATVRNPAAWTEWLKIDAPLQPMKGSKPSIVYFANRLHVVCVHEFSSSASVGSSGSAARVTNSYELQIATLRPSGQWSIRSLLLEHDARRVFAAELRSTTPGIDPVLGVFLVSASRLKLLCFSKLLQVVDSPGSSFDADFIMSIIYYNDHFDIPVLQPLKFEAAVVTGDNKVTSFYSYSYWHSGEAVLIVLFDWAFSKDSSGALKIELNARWDLPFVPDLRFFISRGVGGGWDLEISDVLSSDLKFEGSVNVSVPIQYSDFANSDLYVLRIESSRFYDEYVSLIRTNLSTPARVSNYFPEAQLWVTTAYDSAGQTQLLYTKSGKYKEMVLTTLAGSLLEQKMLEGVDALLSWDVQQLPVDPTEYNGANITRPLSYEGGVGLYTWELFFHAPLLIANRLLAEQRFDEAEHWFKRIFDPAGYRNENGELQMIGTQPRYWNVRPLQEDVAWNPSSPTDTDDPDVIAAADPMHYKLAVYLRTLELLSARGDQLYRQQTRDSLGEARMWYVQALQMLGPRPTLPLALAWDAPTLDEASSTDNGRLLQLEQLVEQQLPLLAPASAQQITVVNGPFRAPVDAAVLAYWDRFEARLYNLRRYLSIDGQPLSLALFEPAIDPAELQLARLAGDGTGSMEAGATPVLWPQRFPLLLERARNAVQQVIQFGASLQGVLERRDADALGVLQQTHQGGLLAIMNEVHAANLASLEHTLEGMKITQATVLARQQHYDLLSSENISNREQHAMDLRGDANALEVTAGVLRVVAGGLNLLPNVAGLAVGWGEVGGLVSAVSDVMMIKSSQKQGEAIKVDTSEQYRRRRQDWDLQRDQARREVEQMTSQIGALTEQIAMTRKQRQQTELEQAYSATVLEVLNTRFTGQALFNWQAARLATLYYQLYDTVSALCTQTQTSLRWETLDARNYLRPGNWNDLYQGLLAGESLLLSLQQMENAYLQWDHRALEVRKTVSLLSLSPSLITDIQEKLSQTPPAPVRRQEEPSKVTVTLTDRDLTLTFNLKDMNITNDYPARLGARRLLKTLSVSLPVLLGPYQNVLALLSYSGNQPIADGCKAVAISNGMDDSGLFQLDFNDGKYLPFEGLPVNDAEFSLVFPNAIEQAKASTPNQQAMLLSLNDIILHINYTIR